MEEQVLNFSVNASDVTDELILKRCKSLKDAIRLCRDCSPLSDDEILYQIEKRTGKKLQKSHFTECLNTGNRNFPPELIQVLEDICDNWIPTRYMALSRKQDLKPKKEALELEVEKLKEELEKERFKLQAISDFLKDKGLKL